MARMELKPAIPMEVMVASAPPVSSRSLSPLTMLRKASAMAWLLDAHAEAVM